MSVFHANGGTLEESDLLNLESATAVLKHEPDEMDMGMPWLVALGALCYRNIVEAICSSWPVIAGGMTLKEFFNAKYSYGVKLRLVYSERGIVVC